MTHAKKTLFINLSISLITVGLCLGGLELIAQKWEYDLSQGPLGWELVASRRFKIQPSGNPEINALLRPNMDYLWEGVPVHINSQGLRDVEHSVEKSRGVYRVLCLGDSVAFGWEIPLGDTYAKQLEKLLNSMDGISYQVINAGILGWDLPIEYAYFKQTGIRYEPDLIIAEVTVFNDIYHTTYIIPPPSPIEWLRANTYSWGFLSTQVQIMRDRFKITARQSSPELAKPDPPFPLDERDPIWDQYIRSPILRMNELAKQKNAGFLLVVFPTETQVHRASAGYPTTAQQVIRKLGEENDIVTIDLLPIFQQTDDCNLRQVEIEKPCPLFADSSSHPSALGHRLAAEAILQAIKENRLLSPH